MIKFDFKIVFNTRMNIGKIIVTFGQTSGNVCFQKKLSCVFEIEFENNFTEIVKLKCLLKMNTFLLIKFLNVYIFFPQ